jgi:hypothetical protein
MLFGVQLQTASSDLNRYRKSLMAAQAVTA